MSSILLSTTAPNCRPTSFPRSRSRYQLHGQYASRLVRISSSTTGTTLCLRGNCSSRKAKMNMTVYSSLTPPPPLPSDSSPGHWKAWFVGMLITAILPFFKDKWGPLLLFKQRVERVVETAEEVADVVENVAEELEKVAEEVADHLPEGGKLKNAAVLVENIAREADKDAHLAEQVIDKVEEVEKEVDSFIEPEVAQITKSNNDEKQKGS